MLSVYLSVALSIYLPIISVYHLTYHVSSLSVCLSNLISVSVYLPLCMCVLGRLVVSDSLRPHAL